MLAFALATSPVVLTGCKTSPATIAFKTIDAVERTTDTAFRNYLRLVRDGVISTDSLSKVSASHDAFQKGLQTAIAAAQGNPQATAPEHLTTQSKAVLDAIAASKGAK